MRSGRWRRICWRRRGSTGSPATSARDAVTRADLVILATDSATPVLEAAWLEPGAYLTTLGPKQVHRHEFGLDLLDRAALVVTDSRAQIGADDPPNVLAAAASPAYLDALVPLSRIVTGDPAPPATEPGRDLSVFLSVGLAGTEAYLFARLLDRWADAPPRIGGYDQPPPSTPPGMSASAW